MLELLREKGSERQFRLFALACCRRIWHLLPHVAHQQLLEAAERQLDGPAHAMAFRSARIAFEEARENASGFEEEHASLVAFDANEAVECTVSSANGYEVALAASDWTSRTAADAARDHNILQREWDAHCRLLQDIFGNPVRPSRLEPSWLTWNGGSVRALAQTIYNEQNAEVLPILADALEEAGCDNTDILSHCRSPGPHVRGCWVVDLILGKK
jgi:hypothetical protein